MADIRLFQFPSKASPTPTDIVYLGDSADAFNEVQSTIAEFIGAYPNLLGIGSLTLGANTYPYADSSAVLTAGTITPLAVSLLADSTTGAMQSTLGLGSAAGHDITFFLQVANNLSDLASASTARTNLGLGTMATQSASSYLALAGGTMAGVLNMGSQFITNLLDPVNAQDGATKNYVDNAVAGAIGQFNVLLASTANFAYTYVNGAAGIGATLTAGAPGTVTMDGVSVALNNIVLFKDQSTAFQNGIYQCTNDGSITAAIFTRVSYYDQPSEIQPGDLVSINSGSTNAETQWRQTGTVTTVGSSSITFAQYTVNPANFLQKANNLSDVNSVSTARTNLSVAASAVTAQVFSVQRITATGAYNYTPPSKHIATIFMVQGAGAGGGGAAGAVSQFACASSGGAGAYMEIYATAAQCAAGSGVSGSVGAKGTGGTAGNNNGNDGGATTIIFNGSTWTAAGGVHGLGSAASASGQNKLGGAGGTNTIGTGATLLIDKPGQAGGFGATSGFASTGMDFTIAGGSSELGFGGQGASASATNTVAGTNGSGKGSGGSGGCTTNTASSVAGGDGTDGIVIAFEICGV